MNSDDLVQLVQKSFRVTLGATTTLIESLQDAQKRDENLSKLNQDWGLLTDEWAVKGAQTEQEARAFVDTLFTSPPTSTASPSSTTAAPGPTAPPDVQLELQELTAQIAAIRAELEKLRNQEPS